MLRFALCGTVLALLAACGGTSFQRSAGGAPVGTDATTGRPNMSATGAGPAGINRNYYTGANPNFPESSSSGRR